jgi:hypothetical protein
VENRATHADRVGLLVRHDRFVDFLGSKRGTNASAFTGTFRHFEMDGGAIVSAGWGRGVAHQNTVVGSASAYVDLGVTCLAIIATTFR